jgi:hypothetical protein
MIRHFPAPSNKKQRDCLHDCCTKENLVEWDCGCSNGCNVCYAVVACKVCGNKIGSEVTREIKAGV